MLITYVGNTPINLTLDSGKSFYAYPKQQNIFISEQDWMLTKRLKMFKDKNLFRVVDSGDDQKPEINPKKNVSVEDIIFDAPQPRFEDQPETLVFDQNNRPIGTRAVTSEERASKIAKKHMKLKKSNSID